MRQRWRFNHRPMQTLAVENQTLAVSFTTLCVDARSQHDYIVLSRLFHTVLLSDVPLPLMESEARRFIALVDDLRTPRQAGGQCGITPL